MDKVICPKCNEIVTEGAGVKSDGVITCDKCKYQIHWECDGETTISK